MTAEQARRARQARARAAGENRNLPVRINERDDGNDGDGGSRRGGSDGRFSTMLGIVSIGLGLTELLAPNAFARAIGIRPSRRTRVTTRLMGLREIASGVGLLVQPERAEWAWSRVAGDAIDMSLLGSAMRSRRNNRPRIRNAAIAALGITALDIMRARQLSDSEDDEMANDDGIRVRKSITINRPAGEVYAFWRDFENLPRFMKHLESVEVTDTMHSHWTAKGPAGSTVGWDAVVTQDEPDRLIAWESAENAEVENSGVVRFLAAPGDRGTEVHVNLKYNPPAGRLGAMIAKLFGEEPAMQVADDLRRFKQVMETGEVVYSDASIHDGMHPAQPSEEAVEMRSSAHADVEHQLVVERAADAVAASSNSNERESTTATRRNESTGNFSTQRSADQ